MLDFGGGGDDSKRKLVFFGEVGLRWRIGDGKRVRVYDDPWIPRLSPFHVVSRPRPGEEDMRVSDLFDGNLAGYSGWNVTRLYSILWNIDVDIIPAVPVGRFRG